MNSRCIAIAAAMMVGAGTLSVNAADEYLRGTGTSRDANGELRTNRQQGLSERDSRFLLAAGKGQLDEITLGVLASQQAASRDTRAFGKQMVDEHTQALRDLQVLASDANASLEMTLDASAADSFETLCRIRGQGFDRRYAEAMVKDHENDVAAFEKAARESDNADVKNFAHNELPMLRHHLEMAKALRDHTATAATQSK